MSIRTQPRPWRRYAALGDSFTEGMCDDLRTDGRHRGWADLVAAALARASLADGGEGIEYANLAIRGRLVREVMQEQIPQALDLRPDLTSLAVGVNDTLRRRFDLDAAATEVETGVRALRASGSDVLLFAFGDPSRRSKVMGSVRERIRSYNSAVEAIAGLYDCYLVRFWDVAAMDDDHFWAEDRLHLSAPGHVLAARSALEALGMADANWRTPMVPSTPPPVRVRAAGHARWVSAHLAPWVVRRAQGASSGDGVTAKNRQWVRVGAGGP